MLRLIVLLLLLANGIYFVWSQCWMRAWDFAPAQQTEPQRMAQQLRPENVRILKAGETPRADTIPQAPSASEPASAMPLVAASSAPAEVGAMTNLPTKSAECFQAGLFDDAQTNALRRTLEASLPAGSWVLEPATEPARWIVYMGKYPNAETLAKKRQELASLNLKFEPLNSASLEPGLSLGGFDTQAAATTALANLTKRGVRTAQVVRERSEARGTLLRMGAADEALKARFDQIRPSLAGKALRLCK
jgi:hypothetical protein